MWSSSSTWSSNAIKRLDVLWSPGRLAAILAEKVPSAKLSSSWFSSWLAFPSTISLYPSHHWNDLPMHYNESACCIPIPSLLFFTTATTIFLWLFYMYAAPPPFLLQSYTALMISYCGSNIGSLMDECSLFVFSYSMHRWCNHYCNCIIHARETGESHLVQIKT